MVATVPTRDRIAEAALGLWRERGYAGASIDEIGDAAGLRGPSIYEHFASKRALLAAVLEPGVRHTRKLAHQAAAEHADPDARFRALIGSYVHTAVHAADRIELYFREEHNLPKDAQRRLRRETTLLTDLWAGALQDVRPDLDAAACRVAVHAMIGLVTSAVASSEDLPANALEPLVTRMVFGALLGE